MRLIQAYSNPQMPKVYLQAIKHSVPLIQYCKSYGKAGTYPIQWLIGTRLKRTISASGDQCQIKRQKLRIGWAWDKVKQCNLDKNNILLIPWQTGVTPSANKAFSYLERGKALGVGWGVGGLLVTMIKLGDKPVNKQRREESMRRTSDLSLLPAL